MPNINEIIKTKQQYLNECGVEVSLFELKLLMADVLEIDVGNLRFCNISLNAEQLGKFNEYVEMKKNFWPIDKILGKKSFYKLDFEVNCDVLSPRYDTEILIEEAVTLFDKSANIDILEFGTGSGCIVISLLDEYKNAKAVGVDISAKALEITQKNALNNDVADRLNLINTGWFDNNIIENLNKKFDIIISNPPYIPSKDIKDLDNEVKNFDPILALDGGEDGLRDYRRICLIAKDLLKKDGFLIFEAGINQAHDIVQIALANNLKFVKIAKDFGGIERCVILKK